MTYTPNSNRGSPLNSCRPISQTRGFSFDDTQPNKYSNFRKSIFERTRYNLKNTVKIGYEKEQVLAKQNL